MNQDSFLGGWVGGGAAAATKLFSFYATNLFLVHFLMFIVLRNAKKKLSANPHHIVLQSDGAAGLLSGCRVRLPLFPPFWITNRQITRATCNPGSALLPGTLQ